MNSNKKPIIVFPCSFPIKILGTNHPDFIPEVIAIVSAGASKFDPDKDVSIKPSTKGNYISITATILAQSQEQLDNIYRALNQHELVKITL